MKILVTAKRVPDPERKVKLKDGAVDLTGMNFAVNPFLSRMRNAGITGAPVLSAKEAIPVFVQAL